MLTLNRYILLDPILLFFMTAAVWGMVKVSKLTKQSHSYTYQWWLWLIFTGTMLSATISVKFVGLFVVFLVGFHTVNELWLILGDLQKPIVSIILNYIYSIRNIYKYLKKINKKIPTFPDTITD